MHDAHTKYKNTEYTKKAELVSASLPTCSAVFCLYELGRHCFICVATLQPSPLTACIREGRMGSSDHCNTWSIYGRIKWATRRKQYVASLNAGLNFTQAARAVDVSKRTGKVWRNERTRATGRNEKPSVDWYRSPVNKPTKLHNATSTRPNAF